MPFSLIPFLLLIIPIAEIAAFIAIGGQIGIAWTLAMIVVTAIVGSILLRIQGFAIVNKLRMEMDAGQVPGRELVHGAMILVAGVLLLTPGFITDSIGFLLFVPPFRDLIWKAVASKVVVRTAGSFGASHSGFRHPGTHHRDGVVDLDEDEYEIREPSGPKGTHTRDDEKQIFGSDEKNPDSPWRN